MKKNGTLLIIAYFYPPIKIIAVLRSYYFSQFISPYFQKVHVITTTNRKLLPSETLPNIENINIHEASTFDYRTLSTIVHRSSVGFEENFKSSSFVKFLIKLNKSFPTTLLWGEGGLIYIIHSFFIASKLIKLHQIETIYSSFSPYSDHIVAYLLKIFFPKLVWIADFRDLHVEPHYDIVYWPSFQHWCNRKILKKANLVTTISDGLAKHLKAYHSNVYIFKNGIPPLSILEKEGPTESEFQSKFTISYTGSMYGNERNPTLLLQVIKDLYQKQLITQDTFQIVYAGKDTNLWLEWLEQFDLNLLFESKGILSLLESKKIQLTSHVNLLLTSATPEWTGVMTGKFYEYLAAKNPIIVLIDGTQDIEFESIMQELNAGCVVYSNHSFNELKSFILEKFNQWQRTGEVKPTIDTEKLKELSWENQVQKFVEHINL
jgi:hypothetical protein